MTEDPTNQLSLETIESYFAQIVQDALSAQTVLITGEAQVYIVHMLCEFALTDRLYERNRDSGHLEREALALLLARADQAPTEDRVQLLRRLGDSSLFISGFFSESLARSPVDVNYYISLGGGAYGTLSDLLRIRRRPGPYPELYAELSQKFRPLVDVLGLVADRSSAFGATNETILRLYDLWQRTGSRRVADKLRACGLDPAATVQEPGGEQ